MLQSVNPHWAHVAKLAEPDIKEALITGYHQGVPFKAHDYRLFPPGIKVDSILDYGCGIGRNFDSLRKYCQEIVAYDIPEMLDACERYADCTNVTLTHKWDKVVAQNFDVGVLTLVIQHIDDRTVFDELLSGLARCCDYLYISTRCWNDHVDRFGIYQAIMDTGHFEYINSHPSLERVVALGFPEETHYDLLLISRKPIARKRINDRLFHRSAATPIQNKPAIPLTIVELGEGNTDLASVDERGSYHHGQQMIADILTQFENPAIDWAFWSDRQSRTLNHDLRYELIAGRYQHRDFLAPGAEHQLRAEQFFIRNCEWSRNFLTQLADIPALSGPEHPLGQENWVNRALNLISRQDSDEFYRHCEIIRNQNYFLFNPRQYRSGNLFVPFRTETATSDQAPNDGLTNTIGEGAVISTDTRNITCRMIWAVYTCERNTEKISIQRRNWLTLANQDPDCRVLYFYGRDPKRNRELAADEIELDVEESYVNLARKTYLMLSWIDRNCQYEHVVKIDDDVAVLDYQQLKMSMGSADYTGFMIRPVGPSFVFWSDGKSFQDSRSVPIDNLPPLYAQGSCYSLSSTMVSYLLRSESLMRELHQPFAFEDAMVGRMVMSRPSTGFTYRNEPGFAETPKHLKPRTLAIGDLDPELLDQVYECGLAGNKSALVEHWQDKGRYKQQRIREMEHQNAIRQFPFLATTTEDPDAIGAIGTCLDEYYRGGYETLILLSDNQHCALASVCERRGIHNYQVGSDNLQAPATVPSHTRCMVVIDQAFSVNRVCGSLISMIKSLSVNSGFFVLGPIGSNLLSMICIDMLKSRSYNAREIGTCKLFTRSLPLDLAVNASKARPFVIWTLQRTGGTNLTVQLTSLAGFPQTQHEPFNEDRELSYISRNWVDHKDEVQLLEQIRSAIPSWPSLKHCVETVRPRITELLVKASCDMNYQHIFLYRKLPVHRLLSRTFAQRTGIWDGQNTDFDPSAFDEPLAVEALVRHEKKCTSMLNNVWRLVLKNGGNALHIAYEDLYQADNRELAANRLLSVLGLLNIEIGETQFRTFYRELTESGNQDTRQEYQRFPNVDELEAALKSTPRFHPN